MSLGLNLSVLTSLLVIFLMKYKVKLNGPQRGTFSPPGIQLSQLTGEDGSLNSPLPSYIETRTSLLAEIDDSKRHSAASRKCSDETKPSRFGKLPLVLNFTLKPKFLEKGETSSESSFLSSSRNSSVQWSFSPVRMYFEPFPFSLIGKSMRGIVSASISNTSCLMLSSSALCIWLYLSQCISTS
ncbi:hypothetical protein D9M68_395020 [compost metagenome]